MENKIIDDCCPLCNNNCQKQLSSGSGFTLYMCDNCGYFNMSDSVLIDIHNPLAKTRYKKCNLVYEFLLRNQIYQPVKDGSKERYCFYYDESSINEINLEKPYIKNIAKLMPIYPKTISERVDRILLNLSVKYPDFGKLIPEVVIQKNEALFFCETRSTESFEVMQELQAVLRMLDELDYFKLVDNKRIYESSPIGNVKNMYAITANGWKHIDEINKHGINQGFIAMDFRNDCNAIYESFKTAIDNCGYIAIRMDKKEHNNRIVPEIFFEIERSKFLVVDLSVPNYGAYYEAGYGQALGKEVLVCCPKDIFDRDYQDKQEEKEGKPHFDIAQKNMIVWEKESELIERLMLRIQATVGLNIENDKFYQKLAKVKGV